PLAGVEPPPVATALVKREPKRVLINRLAGAAVFVAIATVVLTRADQAWMFNVTQMMVMATIFLSITVITGMAGQVSLCQGAFAAIGAFSVFQLVDRYNLSVMVAALIV